MIENKSNEFEVSGNLPGEVVHMGIAADAIHHIMKQLTELYEDPILATIREISTNALDANIEAGVNEPIQVTLPNGLDAELRIKDSGVGLSREDIRVIYSQYGASTKRNSNAVVGMLGFGSKAPLAYADQFVVISVKDGKRIQVAVSRDASGAATQTIVSEVDTDEHNGVEVVVPVRRFDVDTFRQKAANFYKWWKPGCVLINGDEPDKVQSTKLTDDLYIIEGRQSYVIMGNVPYPAKINHGLINNHAVAAYVPIGAVSFPPNRESLKLDEHTNKSIAKIEADFETACKAVVVKEINACKTPIDALKTALKWRSIVPANCRPADSDYAWNGQKIPVTMTVPPIGKKKVWQYVTDPATGNYKRGVDGMYEKQEAEVDIPGRMVLVPDYSSVLSRNTEVRSISADIFPTTIFFYNWDRAKFTAAMRKRLNIWRANRKKTLLGNEYAQDGVTGFVLLKDKPDTTWLPANSVYDWEAEVQPIKLPRPQVNNGGSYSNRIPGSYDVYLAGVRYEGLPVDEIDTEEPIYYVVGRDHVAANYSSLLTRFERDKSCTVVVLTANRLDKFMRLFPNAKKAAQAATEHFTAWKDSITEEDKLALALENDYYIQRKLHRIDPSRLLDMEFARLHSVKNRDLDDLKVTRNLFSQLVSLHFCPEQEIRDPFAKYPLFSTDQVTYNTDHIYRYMNNAYLDRVKHYAANPELDSHVDVV